MQQRPFDLFIKTYEPKYPKATLCLQKDREELMAFFDFPAPHWQSIRTSNQLNRPSRRSGIVPSVQRAACHAMACCT
jgi:transposase-like protein